MLVVDLHAGHGLAGLALLGEDQQVGGPAVVVVGGHQAAAVTLAGLLRHNICCQSLLMFLIMLCTLHTTHYTVHSGLMQGVRRVKGIWFSAFANSNLLPGLIR